MVFFFVIWLTRRHLNFWLYCLKKGLSWDLWFPFWVPANLLTVGKRHKNSRPVGEFKSGRRGGLRKDKGEEEDEEKEEQEEKEKEEEEEEEEEGN